MGAGVDGWGRFPEIHLFVSALLGLRSGRRVWVGPVETFEDDYLSAVPRKRLPALWDLVSSELERESAGLEAVRGRAQFLLATLVAFFGISIAGYPTGSGLLLAEVAAVALWGFGIALLVLASLAAASVVVAEKVVGAVTAAGIVRDNPLLSLRKLCLAGIRAVPQTRATRNANITVFRDSVLLALVGIFFVAAAYAVHSTMLTTSLAPTIVILKH